MVWHKDTADRNAQRMRYYTKHKQWGRNKSQRYTLKEIEIILAHDICDVEIAKLIGRSVQAIQVYRSVLKKKPAKLNDSQANPSTV